MSQSSQEIAILINNQLNLTAAINIGLLFLNADNVFEYLNSMGMDQGSTIAFMKKDGNEYKKLDVYKSLLKYRNDPHNNLVYIASHLMTCISFIGDALRRNSYFTRSPEFEFMRHLRNAISHGNVFHLLNGEPRRTAEFNNISIAPALNGKVALFETVAAGDVLELLEELERQLRSIP